LILEPIVQGAGGMRCYSADFLRRLTQWAQQNDIYVIADEIMTGLGRTGQWLAGDHAGIAADMICLSKGLTAGTLPLSCVLIDHEIYDLFYQSDDPRTAFLHSHTYSGHPLAVCAARATLQTLRNEDLITTANVVGEHMKKCFTEIAQATGLIKNVRSVGAWVAADLIECKHARPGQVLAHMAQQRGALLRPLGNTLYWLPPLNIELSTLDNLAQITLDSLRAVYV
jgi:adenosylmethionine-8-amino-7-oxononanoate aminotransferase